MQTHYEAALQTLKAAVQSLEQQYRHYYSGVVRLEVCYGQLLTHYLPFSNEMRDLIIKCSMLAMPSHAQFELRSLHTHELITHYMLCPHLIHNWPVAGAFASGHHSFALAARAGPD